ncbi:MAG: transposase family protein, partial [Flavobacteriales bacterium]|nr:transposase family protein [Flavobacteriales bacterium]
TPRTDMGCSRNIPKKELIKYCKIISALKLKTSNQKDNHLSTQECISILEKVGIHLNDEFIKVPLGLLKRSTVDRHLLNLDLDYHTVKNIEPIVTRFEAQHSNECWQFDFTPSNLKKLEGADKNLYMANIVDDKSGIIFSKYIETHGEDAMTALHFLFEVMCNKNDSKNNQLQGIPKYIYTDNGAFARSKIFRRVLQSLGITLLTHMPKNSDGRRTTARSKGKVEIYNRTVKNNFESKCFLHFPESLDEANEWLLNYVNHYNKKNHRRMKSSKIKVWRDNLEGNQINEMCSWEHFSKIVRKPDTRKVNSDATVLIDGVSYQLDPQLANKKVTILYGVLDKQVHIENGTKLLGPFYPTDNIIAFGSYREYKKTSGEHKADEIAEIAKNLSVPKSVMSYYDGDDYLDINRKPFEEERCIFSNRIEAKKFIASYIGSPLAQMSSNYLSFINKLLVETLDKELIINQLDSYLAIELHTNKENVQC